MPADGQACDRDLLQKDPDDLYAFGGDSCSSTMVVERGTACASHPLADRLQIICPKAREGLASLDLQVDIDQAIAKITATDATKDRMPTTKR